MLKKSCTFSIKVRMYARSVCMFCMVVFFVGVYYWQVQNSVLLGTSHWRKQTRVFRFCYVKAFIDSGKGKGDRQRRQSFCCRERSTGPSGTIELGRVYFQLENNAQFDVIKKQKRCVITQKRGSFLWFFKPRKRTTFFLGLFSWFFKPRNRTMFEILGLLNGSIIRLFFC